MTSYDISPGRMRLKKFARQVAVDLGRMVSPVRGPASKGVRVLTYHRFGYSPLDPCCQTPEAFEENLLWLAENARVLTPGEFDSYMQGDLRVQENAVLLTFDDGHRSFAQHAMPKLARYGIRAVLFVCPGLIQTGNDSLDWAALRAAALAGHVIASHAYSHMSLAKMSLEDAATEIDAAASALQDRLPAAECGEMKSIPNFGSDELASRFFAYPFGTRADRSNALGDLLAQRGYRYCFTSAHGMCLPGDDRRFLARIKIEGGNEQRLFPHIVKGCMDHWRLIDDSLPLIQQRGRL